MAKRVVTTMLVTRMTTTVTSTMTKEMVPPGEDAVEILRRIRRPLAISP